jgi:hypothetical protein|tara:strand:- start:11084 stop:11509 length:426 start_codon:yes stop_codon:yes gene_type:complete
MRAFVTILLCFSGITSYGQQRLKWSTFERLEFIEVYNEDQAAWLQQPVWSESLLNWDGANVKITGYVIALDVVSKEYALSAFPFASCFFCGAAGPESVLELNFTHPQEFLTDDVVTLRGILKLNTNPLSFPLTLIDAESIE